MEGYHCGRGTECEVETEGDGGGFGEGVKVRDGSRRAESLRLAGNVAGALSVLKGLTELMATGTTSAALAEVFEEAEAVGSVDPIHP